MTTTTIIETGVIDGFAYKAELVIDRSDFVKAAKRAQTSPRKKAWLTAKIQISEKPKK